MFTNADLQNFIIYDVETASEYSSLDELEKNNSIKASLWVKRCEYLRKQWPENAELSNEQLYVEKAALQAEFGKIICISIGKIMFSGSEIKLSIKSYDDIDEKALLKQFMGNTNAIQKKMPNISYIGFNSKRFDVPYITKRCFIHNINVSPVLRTYKVKPWESKSEDVLDIWSAGNWKESFTSLALVCSCLNVPTPKDDISGAEVGQVYWEENNLKRIVYYCEKDVLATTNCILRLANKDIINPTNVITK
jgi:predicted PolB exonuclease-like 3'-5' exonuclease